MQHHGFAERPPGPRRRGAQGRERRGKWRVRWADRGYDCFSLTKHRMIIRR